MPNPPSSAADMSATVKDHTRRLEKAEQLIDQLQQELDGFMGAIKDLQQSALSAVNAVGGITKAHAAASQRADVYKNDRDRTRVDLDKANRDLAQKANPH